MAEVVGAVVVRGAAVMGTAVPLVARRVAVAWEAASVVASVVAVRATVAKEGVETARAGKGWEAAVALAATCSED